MKNFNLFLLLMIFFNLNVSAKTKQLFSCCSKENFCGSRLFEDFNTCLRFCKGKNQCKFARSKLKKQPQLPMSSQPPSGPIASTTSRTISTQPISSPKNKEVQAQYQAQGVLNKEADQSSMQLVGLGD